MFCSFKRLVQTWKPYSLLYGALNLFLSSSRNRLTSKDTWPTQSHSKRRNDPSRLPFLFLSNPSNHSRSYHFPNLLENGFVLWRSRVSLDFVTTSTTSCTRGSEWVFDGFDGFLKYRHDERFDSITRVCKGLRVSWDFEILFNGFNCTSLTLLYSASPANE